MSRVPAVDHLVISVSDIARSKHFYRELFAFLGFEVMGEMDNAMGWRHASGRFWIYQADAQGAKHRYRKGDVGFHHYAWSLKSRQDVDALQRWLEQHGCDHRRPRRRILPRLLCRVFPRSRRHKA